MNRIIRMLAHVLILLIIAVPVVAQTEEDLDREFLSDRKEADGVTEDDLDALILSEQERSGVGAVETKKAKWDCYGFVENVNHFGMPFTDDIDDYEIGKIEIRARVNARYGIDPVYAFLSVDGYLNCHRFDEKEIRDMGSADLQEAYVGGSVKWFQYKAGKQLFSWGAADVFTLTNYLDQSDMRNFFAIHRDDRFRGVWALSMKFLIKDYAIEAAVTPVHSPVMLPDRDTFWEIDPPSRQGMDLRLSRTYHGKLDVDKTSFVIRGGGTAGAVDFHVSYLNGMSNTIIFKPELRGSVVYSLPADYSMAYIEVKPCYERVNSIGFDLAFAVEKLSVRAEALFTPDMFAIKEPGQNDIMHAVLLRLMAASPLNIGDAFSVASDFAEIKQVPYFSYVVGADYNLWGTSGRILVEWVHGLYIAEYSGEYIEPMINKILLVRVEDKFFGDRLGAEIACMMRPDNEIPGWALMAEVGWNFMNGFTITVGGFGFFSNDDDLLIMLENKDMIYTRVRYEF